MRKGYLLWFFTLICSLLVLFCLSLDEVHTLENKDPKISKHPLVAQEKHGTSSNDNVNLYNEGDDENIEAKEHVIDTEKTQRGKGSYGGANVVHQRPSERAAASVLERPFGLFFLILPHLIA